MDPNGLYTLRHDVQPGECDFAVTSINSRGAPGALNRMVMRTLGYPEQELPHEKDLASGFFLLHHPNHKPILFIVNNPEGEVREELQWNLHNGLLTYLSDMEGKRVWLPLMGTGAGRLELATSFEITRSVLERLDYRASAPRPQFFISVPEGEEGAALMARFGEDFQGPAASPNVESGGSGRNYWLAKMGSAWSAEKLEAGATIFFQPRDAMGKELHAETPTVRPRDSVLAFLAYTKQHVLCEMEVEEQIELTHEIGVRLKVSKLFYRPIPIGLFNRMVPPEAFQSGYSAPYEGFIPLSEEVYKAILALEEQPFQNNFLPFYATEGAHAKTEDQLDFEADIDSFATVICLKSVTPPLAIGLFGNWGSGKSFFMQKLEERIEKLRASEYPEFVRHVVPVRFNSWHYSDANLWASMIMQIFESLNRYAEKTEATNAVTSLYAELNVTKAQLAETQKALDEKAVEAAAVAAQKTSVEAELEEKRRTLDLWKGKEIMRLVFSDPFVQEDIRLLNEQFNKGELTASTISIEQQLREAGSAAGQLREAWKDAKKHSRGGWLWVWLTVLAVGAACLAAYFFFREEIQGFIDGLTVPVAMLATGLAGFAAKLSPYLRKARAFYESLKGVAQRIEKKKSKLELEKESIVEGLRQSITALDAEKTALGLRRSDIETKKKVLEDELRDIGSGKMLAGFLAGKSSDDAYLRQLGIISWIRKDFEQLNDYFERQKEVRQTDADVKPTLQIDRIVLYIDDLDRCNEDVVVKVLEAVHLLLAFPLFVVVVGVDPRWLNNALTEKYKLLFGAGKGGGESTRENALPSCAATSYDYLEKIFQIPFALKPITKSGREKLIQYLVRDELQTEDLKEKESEKTTTATEYTMGASNSVAAAANVSQAQAQRPVPAPPQAVQQVPGPEKKSKEKLVITAEELEYMQQIAPLFGNTPRTINRYVNIYRIIKTHGSLTVQGPYERDEFVPIMFLLAVIVGHAPTADLFIQRLDAADEDQPCGEFLKGCGMDGLCAAAYPLLGKLEKMGVKCLKQNLPLVSRFSFRALMKNLG